MTSGGHNNGAEFNGAFMLMQYFAYLRHNPDDLADNDLVAVIEDVPKVGIIQ
jgi:hypothetical protein